MFQSINYLSASNGAYKYKLVDSAFSEDIEINFSDMFNDPDLRTRICNGLLTAIYNRYRFSEQCPFKSIEIYYNNIRANNFQDRIALTEFYRKHSKVMDKIMCPPSIDNGHPYSILNPWTSPTYAYTTNTAVSHNYTFTISDRVSNWTIR